MDTGFQPMPTGNQFVPIPRQSNAAIMQQQQQQPFTGGQTMDNSLNNGMLKNFFLKLLLSLGQYFCLIFLGQSIFNHQSIID